MERFFNLWTCSTSESDQWVLEYSNEPFNQLAENERVKRGEKKTSRRLNSWHTLPTQETKQASVVWVEFSPSKEWLRGALMQPSAIPILWHFGAFLFFPLLSSSRFQTKGSGQGSPELFCCLNQPTRPATTGLCHRCLSKCFEFFKLVLLIKRQFSSVLV